MIETMEITVYDQEVLINIEYVLIPESRGAREKGLQLEPDEAAFIEIENVKMDYSGKNEAPDFVYIDLPESVLESLANEIMMGYE